MATAKDILSGLISSGFEMKLNDKLVQSLKDGITFCGKKFE